MRLLYVLALAFFCAVSRPALAEEIDYLRDIKPILQNRCYSCHGAIRSESELRLDTAKLIRKGGDSGPAVTPKSIDEGLLLTRVTSTDADLRMPPEGDRLTKKQIDLLRKWIKAGAIGPANEQPQADTAKHWSFQPLVREKISGRNRIDDFIDTRLRAANLKRQPVS